MKNILNKKYTIILLMVFTAGLVITGCKKFISPDPVSSFSTSQIFSNLPYTQSAVIGVYNAMANQNYYGLYMSMVYPFDTDDFMGIGQASAAATDGNSRDIARWNVTPTNGTLAAPYSQIYAGIERANICIKNIPKMDLYANGAPKVQGELKRLYGEVLTLRALYYSDLIKNWGDVPEQRVPSADLATPFLAKTDRDSIYDHIIGDLLIAEDLVPWRTEIAQLGDVADERITKGAVKALRARLALYRGGYSLRRVSGIMERSADYLKYYQIAKDECAGIMARRDQHTLNPSYKSVWKDYICGRLANEPNGEILFQIAEGGNGTGSADGRIGLYNGTKFGTSSNGSINALPLYYYYFDSTDVRRDVTIAPYETNNDGLTRKGHAINSLPDGKFRREWWSNPVNPLLNTLNSGINWPLIRFSDVLLMFAEADNEVSHGPSSDAISAANEVSKRGHGGNQALVPTIPTDYTGFFKFIVKERYLEFGDEAIRKYDLIRWNLIATAITETRANLANIGTVTPIPINPPSYMAPPPSYCLTATLPKFMYYFNSTTADDSKIWATSLYTPAPAVAPAGTTKVNWMGLTFINSTYTTIWAYGFKPNHSELVPIYSTVISASRGVLTQDYGY